MLSVLSFLDLPVHVHVQIACSILATKRAHIHACKVVYTYLNAWNHCREKEAERPREADKSRDKERERPREKERDTRWAF